MATYEKLYAKAVTLYDKADEMLTAEEVDMEAVNAVIAEAKAVELQAKTAKDLQESRAAIKQPQRKSILPTGDPEPANAMPTEPEKEAEFEAKAAYVMRYGNDEDAMVKSVLTDLHGKGYAQTRYNQDVAFKSYLRAGDKALDYNQVRLLKSPVATPMEVKALIRQGVDVPQMKATMVEGIGNLGGYVVPGDFSANVIQRLPGMTVMRGLANEITTSRDQVTLPVDKGGGDQYTANVRETWVAETPTSTAADTNLTFSMKDVPVHTALGGVPISKNLIEDAAFDIVAHLTNKFAEAAAINEDNAFLVGDGVGKPSGLLPGSTNANSITEVVSGHATLIDDFDELIQMTFGIASQYLDGAVWLGNRATFKAIAQLVDSDGAYHWRETRGDNVSGLKRVLLGFPVVMQEAMPTIAANAYPLIFGNLGAYTIINRLGMTVERYDDSTTASTNSVKYVMRRRLGGQLVEPYRLAVMKIST